uniref:DNA polymerase subunit gamma-1 n=1 Tax=Simocephalus serrulatus TaxID=117539 RepID=A0A4Y7NN91_9CRUS|nr:EOG090X00SQ [Simocephalus serrulatus]SVE94067.1 EOG090X00SQ [Simocephalus serrulatus]
MLLATKTGAKVDRIAKNYPYQRNKHGKMEEVLEWQNVSSFNGLSDVHKLYCGGLGLEKEKRNVFVNGSLAEIKNDFQQLVTYCARDCLATFQVLRVLFPEYLKRFPHPVTLAGMLEMSTAYLPVNRNWLRYLQDSEDTYKDLENELTQSLKREADRACHLMENESYKNDPWLWDLDWLTKPLKIKKKPVGTKKKKTLNSIPVEQEPDTVTVATEELDEKNDEEIDFLRLRCQFQNLLDSNTLLYKRNSLLPGYPNWYRTLCDRTKDGLIGPSEVTTSAQVVPKLLKLTWEGFPLYHSRELGWGYLVPGRPLDMCQNGGNGAMAFPLKDALSLFPPRTARQTRLTEGIITAEEALLQIKNMSDITADPVELATHWMDRIGSELKSMIQCPLGFTFVGADVDSQELWIASIIGDSHFAGQHGSTAFGWMTLQGKKSDGTDMHSRTASTVQITRDQAKILNYGRIYGAGERFAKTLLMQFNHRLTEQEAIEKARKMYSVTKGNSVFQLNNRGRQLAAALGQATEDLVTQEQLNSMRKMARQQHNLAHLANLRMEDLIVRKVWSGGTESHMFNKLEEIAQSATPKTPVLHCRISRALEPRNVGNEFMTSRVNWVVQSSAVDYLHLMLVAMRYLCDNYKIEGRFCISIHDEVRYLIKDDDKFRAALALQVANLWTRCMFAYQLDLEDLPQAVAFFSSVDIDKVLRKETNLDCQTPSNPYGLKRGYGIDFGSSYDIYQILEKTNGCLNSVK